MSALGFGLYLLFMCSWFLHVPARYPILNGVRADLMLVSVILVLTVVIRRDGPATASDARTTNLLWLLVAYAAVSIPFVEWPGSVARTGFPNFFKAFVFFYFTVSLVTTPRRLKYLLLTFLACQIFRVLEPLYLHVTVGYWGSVASMADWERLDRLSGAPSDVVNPNGLASIVLTAVSLLHYLTAGSVLGRIVYVGCLPALLWALVLTASRSGMIGLAGIFGQVWWKSRHKLVLALITAAAVVFTLPRLSADLADRYLSIVSSSTKNAETAHERVDGMKINLEVAMQRPLFGYGLGTSEEANWNFGGTALRAHNLYLEVAQEVGFIGLVIFLAFIGSLVAGLRRASEVLRATRAPPPIVVRLIPALQVFLGMNLLFSFASYGLSTYDWYLTAGLTEVIGRLLAQSGAETAPAGVPAPAGLSALPGGVVPPVPVSGVRGPFVSARGQ